MQELSLHDSLRIYGGDWAEVWGFVFTMVEVGGVAICGADWYVRQVTTVAGQI